MIYLLDTNAVSGLMAEHPRFLSRLATLPPEDRTVICPIVRGEILYGIELLPVGKRRSIIAEKAAKSLAMLPCEQLGEAVGDNYARLRRDCESRGFTVYENDLRIAALALDIRAVVVTRDRDLSRVAGIRVEDWTA